MKQIFILRKGGSMNKKSDEIVREMTLEEKAGMCSGRDTWWLKSLPHLGINSIMMSDGPHGLRKQLEEGDNLGLSESLPAVCYPTASALACSFDRELIFKVGASIAKEARAEKISVVLGPGVNIKRSPLCGRNFEYFSEDPLVSGELGAAMINGMQSLGIGASLKHFALNNQETRRRTVNVVVDERAFREIYLKPFEIAVKKSKPWTVMCAYNRIEGYYCSENKRLLNDILRNEWGYEGLVVSDWGAVNNRPLGVEAGNDLEMPGSFGLNDKKIIDAIETGKLKTEDLDKAVKNVVNLILKSQKNIGDYKCDIDECHEIAVNASEEAAVLLKNKDSILPLSTGMKIAVIGEMAKQPRYQGTGSSKINPYKIESAWDYIKTLGIDAVYSEGENADEVTEMLKDRDVAIIFAGMTDIFESEGFDRVNLAIPKEQNELINRISESFKNIVVVLAGGAPMELPWVDKVKGILMMYLGGEGVGRASINLIFGKKSPSGKLAETWPLSLSDTPAYNNFPGGRVNVEYRESIYVGYRYYDTAKLEVLFPFGFGLSYTEFKYSNLNDDGENITVTVENTGNFGAKHVVLLFVSHVNPNVFMASRELKGFEKVFLNPGEKKMVNFPISNIDLSYYNTKIPGWHTDSGEYIFSVGDLEIKRKVYSVEVEQGDYINLTLKEFPKSEFEVLYGKELGDCDTRAKRPFTINNNLEDVQHTLIGKLVHSIMKVVIKKIAAGDQVTIKMIMSEMLTIPFHVIIASYPDMMKPNQVEGLINILNLNFIKGFKKLIWGK